MTSKTILVLAIATAFVAGTMTSGSDAFAKDDDKKGNPIVRAINALTEAVQGIDPTVNIDPTPVNVNVDPTPITNNINVDPTSIENIVNVEPTPITINTSGNNDLLKNIELTPGVVVPQLGLFGLYVDAPNEAFLFFGDKLCSIDRDTNTLRSSILIVFTEETIVGDWKYQY